MLVALVYLLGVELIFILQILLGMMLVAMVLTSLFFFWVGITFIGSERKKVRFDRIDKAEKSYFPTAVYVSGDKEFRNAFPSEMMLRGLLYKNEKTTTVRVTKHGKVYDIYSRITVLLGMILAPLSVIGMTLWFSWSNVFYL